MALTWMRTSLVLLLMGLNELLSKDSIMKILRGPFKGMRFIEPSKILVVSETAKEWKTKTSNKKGFILKLDFEKACDKVCWSFLDEILKLNGFRQRWRKWICGCLTTTNFSILINGSQGASLWLREGLDKVIKAIWMTKYPREIEVPIRKCVLDDLNMVGRIQGNILHLVHLR